MSYPQTIGAVTAAVCLIISCIMASQLDCTDGDFKNLWILLIICAVLSSIVALSYFVDMSSILSGTVTSIIFTACTLFAGALLWDLLYVHINSVCVDKVFFDAPVKYVILYILELVGAVAMVPKTWL